MLSVIRGGRTRADLRTPSRAERDELRRYFDREFRTAIITSCTEITTRLSTKLYDVRRDALRSDRPWSQLLRVIDELIAKGARVERVEVLADLIRAYAEARAAERPTPAEGVVAIPEFVRKAA
jgi:hypothetical protein